MKEYNTATKDNVLNDFSSGTGVMELSRKYEIPKSTLQGWIKRAIHHHHWLVESPNGPKSKGRCTVCKEERYFNNWIEESSWPKSRPAGPNQNGIKQKK
jgi:transposase-like protein